MSIFVKFKISWSQLRLCLSVCLLAVDHIIVADDLSYSVGDARWDILLSCMCKIICVILTWLAVLMFIYCWNAFAWLVTSHMRSKNVMELQIIMQYAVMSRYKMNLNNTAQHSAGSRRLCRRISGCRSGSLSHQNLLDCSLSRGP